MLHQSKPGFGLVQINSRGGSQRFYSVNNRIASSFSRDFSDPVRGQKSSTSKTHWGVGGQWTKENFHHLSGTQRPFRAELAGKRQDLDTG